MHLYETHIPVTDLERSKKFYTEVVGLELAYEQPQRQVAFFWIGGPEQGMLGIWGPGALYGWQGDERFKSHFAIGLPLDELLAAPARLQAQGVAVRGFNGVTSGEPSVIGWMPSAQIYFEDPDGHSVEFITVLNDPPQDGFHGSWTEWRRLVDAG